MGAKKPSPHEQAAIELTQKILKKAADALEPLEREMRLMGWAPEYRAIMWGAVERKARALKNGE